MDRFLNNYPAVQRLFGLSMVYFTEGIHIAAGGPVKGIASAGFLVKRQTGSEEWSKTDRI